MSSNSIVVIPARLASTRLPEKLLRTAGDRSILHHTYRAAGRCSLTDRVVVAVDDQRLADEVDSFGGEWILTSPDCASGTDRIAEVAAAMPEIDVFINVQGDEPEIEPHVIDLVGRLLTESDADMSTVGTPIRDLATLHDPSCVKIVLAASSAATGERERGGTERGGTEWGGTEWGGAVQGRAVYFSRAPVPHHRDGVDPAALTAEPPNLWHHIGLYAYRREFLEWFARQPPSPLEQIERLEQLRAIEAGKKIVVGRVDSATPGIDTEADLQAFIGRLQRGIR